PSRRTGRRARAARGRRRACTEPRRDQLFDEGLMLRLLDDRHWFKCTPALRAPTLASRMKGGRNRAERMTCSSTKRGALVRRFSRGKRRTEKLARLLAELELAAEDRPRRPARPVATLRVARH